MSIKMSPRERVLKALRHEEPNRVPLDATFDTSSSDSSGVYHIDSPNAQEEMMNHLKTDDFEVVLERLGVDVRRIEPKWNYPDTGNI